MGDFPVIEGLTETRKDSEPLITRLSDFLAQKPGGASEAVRSAIKELQRGFSLESNEKMKDRISIALATLKDGDSARD